METKLSIVRQDYERTKEISQANLQRAHLLESQTMLEDFEKAQASMKRKITQLEEEYVLHLLTHTRTALIWF